VLSSTVSNLPYRRAAPGSRTTEEIEMKEGIHPKYDACTVTCSCGASFETRSNRPQIKTEVCSECHPFYTGKEKMMDTEGRVERFRRKYGLQKPAAPQ
jgi:large subunit ribosomal protein L31